jgi:GTP-binding protein EngB required for normal cell division
MILLLGQYSVGKTSFIRYIIGREFPGARIGPEPTTDRFNVVMGGTEDRIIPGNALAVDPAMPFTSLTRFGTEFLNKFQASMCKSPTLDKVYFVDSPGVLSGEKQKLGRAYDFTKVVEWFAQRPDMILLLFDAHKLDISDEFQSVIKACKGQDDKIRVVLNKADKVTSQQLMRVYGALMWSLGKVVQTPEVMRVYIGSFWDGECM